MRAEIRSLGPIERVVYLRTLPLFGSMPTQDLAAIAEWTEEREFAAGETLLEEGAAVESLHILARGTARMSRGAQAFRVFGPRDAVGLIGLLARDERGVRAVALERCTTLELGRRPLLRMFEERFQIFQHLLREVAGLLLQESGEVAGGGDGSEDPAWAAQPGALDRVDLVDRMQWLGTALRFARSHPLSLAELARTAEVRRVPAGGIVQYAGDVAETVAIPVSGRLAVDSPGMGRSRAAMGAALGVFEAFAQQGYRLDVLAEEPSTVLVVRRETVLDAFEDHAGLALDCLAEVASRLLAVFMQRAETEIEIPHGLGGARPPSGPAAADEARQVWLRG